MAAATSQQETAGGRKSPGHKQKEKTMIFHINLFTLKPGLSDEQRDAGLDLMRQDAANPAVTSWTAGGPSQATR